MMKKLIILIAFTLSLFHSGRSQVKISIVDSLSREPLSYATVYQFSGKSLFLCTNLGEIKLNIVGEDTISVSYAGYVNKIIPIGRNINVEVPLIRDIRILPDIVIKACAEWSKGFSFKPEADSGSFGGFQWGSMAGKGRIAMFVPAKGNKSKLLSFVLYCKPGIRASKESVKAPIHFSFYSVDTATMLPSALLTTTTVIFKPKRSGAQQVNVDSIHFIIPESGFYLALESYQDDAYSYWIPMKMENGNIENVKMNGAALDGLYSKDTWLSFYNFTTGKWIFGGGKPFDITRKHGAIKYEMKYAVCKDQH